MCPASQAGLVREEGRGWLVGAVPGTGGLLEVVPIWQGEAVQTGGAGGWRIEVSPAREPWHKGLLNRAGSKKPPGGNREASGEAPPAG